jgi:hypothetical protein
LSWARVVLEQEFSLDGLQRKRFYEVSDRIISDKLHYTGKEGKFNQSPSKQAGNRERWYNICRLRKRDRVMRSCVFQAWSPFAGSLIIRSAGTRETSTLQISIHRRQVTRPLHIASPTSIARFASSNESESRVSVALPVIWTVSCACPAPLRPIQWEHHT